MIIEKTDKKKRGRQYKAPFYKIGSTVRTKQGQTLQIINFIRKKIGESIK